MARRLIGSGKTDSNGKVTVPFEGKGLGKLQIVAECGSLQSEIYSLYDVIFKDIGTDTQYTAWTYLNNVTVSRDITETKMVQINTANIGSQYQTLTTEDFTIECDIRVEDHSFVNLFSLRNGSSAVQNISISPFGLNDGDTHHITLQCINNVLTVKNNDTIVGAPITLTNTVNRIYLQTQSGMTVYYKNFMIY